MWLRLAIKPIAMRLEKTINSFFNPSFEYAAKQHTPALDGAGAPRPIVVDRRDRNSKAHTHDACRIGLGVGRIGCSRQLIARQA
jgi:hypothetical protein